MTSWPARVAIPTPPSLNSSYFNAPGRGRIKAPSLRRWQVQAAHALALADPPCVVGDAPYAVELYLPINRRSDVDNRLKAILDLLRAEGYTPDDRWCDLALARRVPQAKSAKCEVVWYPLEGNIVADPVAFAR